MLWRAGQERIVRERKERLADLFWAARDAAIDVGVSTRALKPERGYKRPSYVETPEPERTPATRDAMLRQLAGLFPGMVRIGGDA